MTIQITQPEVELLIEQRLRAGGFASPEDVVLRALRAFDPSMEKASSLEENRTGADLIAAMQASPCREISIEPARYRLPVREVTL